MFRTEAENIGKNRFVKCRCGHELLLELPQAPVAPRPLVPPVPSARHHRLLQAGLLLFYLVGTLLAPYAWHLSGGAALAVLGWWALESRPRLAGFANLLGIAVVALTLLLVALLTLAVTQPTGANSLTPPPWLLRLDGDVIKLKELLGKFPLLAFEWLAPLLVALYILARLRPDWPVFSWYDREKAVAERLAGVVLFLSCFTFLAPTFADPLLEFAWQHQYRLVWRDNEQQQLRQLMAVELQRQVQQATATAPVQMPRPLRPALHKVLAEHWAPPVSAPAADAPAATAAPTRRQARADADRVLDEMGLPASPTEARVSADEPATETTSSAATETSSDIIADTKTEVSAAANARADASWAATHRAHRAEWGHYRRLEVASLTAEAHMARQRADAALELVSKLISETLGFAIDSIPLPWVQSFVGSYLKELTNYATSRVLEQEVAKDFVVRLFKVNADQGSLGNGLLGRLRGFWQRQRTPLACDKCRNPVSADAEKGDACPRCQEQMFTDFANKPWAKFSYRCLECDKWVSYACIGCTCPACGTTWNEKIDGSPMPSGVHGEGLLP